MTEDPRDNVEIWIRAIEKHRGITLTKEQRASFEQRFIENKKRREANAFMDKFKDRQGTIFPDFNALYEKKAELDRWLTDQEIDP